MSARQRRAFAITGALVLLPLVISMCMRLGAGIGASLWKAELLETAIEGESVGASGLPSRFEDELFALDEVQMELLSVFDPNAGQTGGGGFEEDVLALVQENPAHDAGDALEEVPLDAESVTGVVGLQSRESEAECMEHLRNRLEEKGWVCTPSGIDCFVTLTKEAGCFRWVAIHCTQVAGSCTVVIQYSRQAS